MIFEMHNAAGNGSSESERKHSDSENSFTSAQVNSGSRDESNPNISYVYDLGYNKATILTKQRILDEQFGLRSIDSETYYHSKEELDEQLTVISLRPQTFAKRLKRGARVIKKTPARAFYELTRYYFPLNYEVINPSNDNRLNAALAVIMAGLFDISLIATQNGMNFYGPMFISGAAFAAFTTFSHRFNSRHYRNTRNNLAKKSVRLMQEEREHKFGEK